MEMISTGTCPESAIPAVGHTQRATINQNRHEIHVMTVSLQCNVTVHSSSQVSNKRGCLLNYFEDIFPPYF